MKQGIINVVMSVAIALGVVFVPAAAVGAESANTLTVKAETSYTYTTDMNNFWDDMRLYGSNEGYGALENDITHNVTVGWHTATELGPTVSVDNFVGTLAYTINATTKHYGQTFTVASNGRCGTVEMHLSKSGTPGNLTCKLYICTGSTPITLLETVTILASDLTTNNATLEIIEFNSPLLVGNTYALVFSAVSVTTSNYYQIGMNESNSYSGGTAIQSTNSGSSYTTISNSDLYFRINTYTGMGNYITTYRSMLFFPLDVLDSSKITQLKIVLHTANDEDAIGYLCVLGNSQVGFSQEPIAVNDDEFYTGIHYDTDYQSVILNSTSGVDGFKEFIIAPSTYDTANSIQWLVGSMYQGYLCVGVITESELTGDTYTVPRNYSGSEYTWVEDVSVTAEFSAPGTPDIVGIGAVEPYIEVSYLDGALSLPAGSTPFVMFGNIDLQLVIDALAEQTSGIRWLILLGVMILTVIAFRQIIILAYGLCILEFGAFLAMGLVDMWLILLLAAVAVLVVWLGIGRLGKT